MPTLAAAEQRAVAELRDRKDHLAERGGLDPRGWLLLATAAAGLGMLAVTIVEAPMPARALLALGAAGLLGTLVLGRLRQPLLAAIVLDIPLELDVHLAYQPDVAQLGAIPGFNVSLTTLALGGCLALWLVNALVGLPVPSPAWRAAVATVPYIGVLALSLLWARNPLLAAFEVFLMLQLGLLYLYLASTLRTVADVVFVVRLLLVGVLVELALAVTLGAIGSAGIPPLSRASSSVAPTDAGRFSGTLSSPTIAGAYFSLLLPLAMSVVLTPVDRATRALALLAVGAGGLGLLLTQTRGAWIAFVLAAGLFILALWRRGRLSARLVIPMSCVGGLGLLGAGLVLQRLTGFDEGSAHSRLPLLGLALRIIGQHPLLGVGANNFALALQSAATPNFGDTGDWLYVVHNKLLLVWAETGLVGLATFLFFLATAAWNGWRCWRSDHPVLAVLGLAMLTALIGDFVHMQVDIFNDRALLQLLWLMAGLLAAMRPLSLAPSDRSRGPRR